jgi:hypothetical protein
MRGNDDEVGKKPKGSKKTFSRVRDFYIFNANLWNIFRSAILYGKYPF